MCTNCLPVSPSPLQSAFQPFHFHQNHFAQQLRSMLLNSKDIFKSLPNLHSVRIQYCYRYPFLLIFSFLLVFFCSSTTKLNVSTFQSLVLDLFLITLEGSSSTSIVFVSITINRQMTHNFLVQSGLLL